MNDRPIIALVGSLDTKGEEYAFARDAIREDGADAILIDVGVLGEPSVRPISPPRRSRRRLERTRVTPLTLPRGEPRCGHGRWCGRHCRSFATSDRCGASSPSVDRMPHM